MRGPREGDVQAQPLLFCKFLGFRERWAFEDERPRRHVLGQRVFLLLFSNESGGCRGGRGVLFSVCCHHLRWFSLISSNKGPGCSFAVVLPAEMPSEGHVPRVVNHAHLHRVQAPVTALLSAAINVCVCLQRCSGRGADKGSKSFV